MRANVLGAVLAGGRSRRFGGDKALACLSGMPLIEHAADSLSRHVSSLVFCGRDMPNRVSLQDRPQAELGPLGGLSAALYHASNKGFDGVLTIACDMPLLPDDLGKLLIGTSARVLEGHWLAGYWPVALSATLDAHLSSSPDRSMRTWIEVAGAEIVATADRLPNINTRDDLAALIRSRGIGGASGT